MSEQLYRYLRVPDEAVDFDCHQYVSTWMVPITEELLTRAEWEATIQRCEHGKIDRHLILPDTPGIPAGMYLWCPGAAMGIEENEE